MVKFKPTCPSCFIEKGWSIPLEESSGVYQCTREAAHRFIKNREGYLVRA